VAEESKDAVRRRILASRVPRAIIASELPRGTVASYLPLRDEPDPAPLLVGASLILLPRMLADRSLQLCPWAQGEPLRPGLGGTLEPLTEAVDPALVDVILVPALAVDPDTGVRLGRGGGSYDRLLPQIALARRWAVLNGAEELIAGLPREAHDAVVAVVVLPERVLHLPA
jgi:5-formyltetrahydrofolate cyclo-ligase